MSHLKLDWSHWLYALFGAFIGGGSSAVTASLVAMGVTPDRYDLGLYLANTLKMMAGCFILNGIVGAILLLKQKPLPDIETEVTERTTTISEPKRTTEIHETTTTTTPASTDGSRPDPTFGEKKQP